ncbi:Peroxidase [Actinidia chinensis var. chinensis]|uniref:Peroxidase n=1 Tax=Actinidia chinensis var. chinensis TaxID=1590841 RepID=A0A2R6P757_ACTCC|nr:Peroxidase [Actinidia chinensis var. chinensis]
MSKAGLVAVALGLMMFMNFTSQCYGALQFGFYNGKCNSTDVEDIVEGVITGWIKKDPSIVAALLRMQFHDCFSNGCDASILLDGSNSEKTARPNLSVRGYEVIDAAKAAVEAKCPDIVSCADIIVMATRDAVAWSKGRRYDVQTGRRDGFESLAEKVDLPPPTISVSDSIKAFSKRQLDVSDMVYLLGGHSVGVAHCSLFQDRLYNYQNSGLPDRNMDPALLATLRAKCPQNETIDNTADLDQNPSSALAVDNSFYRQIFFRRGVLKFDQDLASDPQTQGLVTRAAFGYSFPYGFGQAMVKLGEVQVLTGSQGEIRKSCRAVNNPKNILSALNINA